MFSTLRGRLIGLCVAVVVLAMLAVAAANYASTRNRTLETMNVQTRQLAASQAAAIGDWVAARRSLVSSLRHAAPLAQPQPLLKAAAQAGGFDNVYIGYADKRIASSRDEPPPADYDPTTRAWYRKPVEAGGPVITPPYVDAGRGELVVTFAEPAPQAVLAADVSLAKVVAQVLALHPTPGSYAFLIDREGRVIAHPQKERTMQMVDTLGAGLSHDGLAALESSGGNAAVTLNGRDCILFATAVPGTGWLLALVLDRAEATAGLSDMLLTSAMTAVVLGIAAAVVLSVLIARELRSLHLVRDALSHIADGDGDLTRRLDDGGPTELAQISRAFNRFADQISDVLRQIRLASDMVRMAAADIAGGNGDLSARTEAQASSLEQTVSAMQSLTNTVQGTAANARSASELAVSASRAASSGGLVVQNVVQTMDRIRDGSRRMADIIGAIDALAFQTNILALNAAVEAARAGEQGRGFAVVAAEVRTLAQSSAAAAQEIRELIADAHQRAETGSMLAGDAGQHMERIVSSVHQVAGLIGAISAASQEQSAGIAEVNGAIGYMDEVTQQNAALVEQAASAADSMKEQAVSLASTVGRFTL
ncbi:methyl-accepting chemotaxis sensory transducer with Cache sensor [Duganella sacchari]|uniref:Methyl-accepting chemotaxis sensory transducer with Cache sensor n=1 Tax=Duganella sacchari TaxID=551987 RepID=A0A1M7R7P4_9BURK|nr:methyl-accepting chemotaxis protein [Duganella sacchari]SHN42068.1 methyl-accepting chemotaxis sensory transducer with Cache sensor [Duganella sacchari]